MDAIKDQSTILFLELSTVLPNLLHSTYSGQCGSTEHLLCLGAVYQKCKSLSKLLSCATCAYPVVEPCLISGDLACQHCGGQPLAALSDELAMSSASRRAECIGVVARLARSFCHLCYVIDAESTGAGTCLLDHLHSNSELRARFPGFRTILQRSIDTLQSQRSSISSHAKNVEAPPKRPDQLDLSGSQSPEMFQNACLPLPAILQTVRNQSTSSDEGFVSATDASKSATTGESRSIHPQASAHNNICSYPTAQCAVPSGHMEMQEASPNMSGVRKRANRRSPNVILCSLSKHQYERISSWAGDVAQSTPYPADVLTNNWDALTRVVDAPEHMCTAMDSSVSQAGQVLHPDVWPGNDPWEAAAATSAFQLQMPCEMAIASESQPAVLSSRGAFGVTGAASMPYYCKQAVASDHTLYHTHAATAGQDLTMANAFQYSAAQGVCCAAQLMGAAARREMSPLIYQAYQAALVY